MRGGVVALTDVLDLCGALLLVLGLALLVAVWTVPGAFVAAGLLVLALSWLIDRRAKR